MVTNKESVSMRPKLAVGRSTVFSVLFGAIFGFSISYVFFVNDRYSSWSLYPERHTMDPIDTFKFHGSDEPEYLKQLPLPRDGPAGSVDMHDEHEKDDGDTAAMLAENVRVLCWIMTQPKSHTTKARHVKATWGRRCNYLLFMSSEADMTLPAIRLNVSEGRDSLWAKTKESFKHVYRHYMDKVDWVLKADDDTYVVVENLRYVLSMHNATDRLYMGCKFKPYVKQGYMSGGAGYVLSKEAVKAFVEEALPNKTCRQDGRGAEDVEMGKCMQLVGAKAIDSRDEFGRHRFFPLPPAYHLVPDSLSGSNWFWRYIYYPVNKGFECCSDTTISFHYISPNDMYVLEFFIYHVKPYGVRYPHLEERIEKPVHRSPQGTTTAAASHVTTAGEITNNNLR